MLSRLLAGAVFRRIGVGALITAVLAVGGWLYHGATTNKLRAEAADTRLEAMVTNRDAWRALAEHGVDRIAHLEAERRHAEAAVQQLQVRLADREVETRARTARIRAAPPEDDGPVARVLADAIEALP